MGLETKKGGFEGRGEQSSEQIEVKQLNKLSEQLQLNEQSDLRETGKESEKEKKLKKAMKAITAGAVALAITILSSMGPNEAYAGGVNTGELSGFKPREYTTSQSVEIKHQNGGKTLGGGADRSSINQRNNGNLEKGNPNISINGKAGKIIFEDEKTTVYGDENTKYQKDSRGNTAVSGGVVIER